MCAIGLCRSGAARFDSTNAGAITRVTFAAVVILLSVAVQLVTSVITGAAGEPAWSAMSD